MWLFTRLIYLLLSTHCYRQEDYFEPLEVALEEHNTLSCEDKNKLSKASSNPSQFQEAHEENSDDSSTLKTDNNLQDHSEEIRMTTRLEDETEMVSEQGANIESVSDTDQKLAEQPSKISLEILGFTETEPREEKETVRHGASPHENEVWTEQTEEGVEHKRTGSRRFFSLMNLIKFLLNPVIEEFQEMEKSAASSDVPATRQAADTSTNNNISSELARASSGNSSGEPEDRKNSTESGKKTKFHCSGRNVTENTTAVVRVVNSTVLLELLSFDKNHSTSDCVLVMFYAPWCHFCAATAPHYNAVARAFPQLEVLAVDTVHFSNLNARFGTVAVPNIMLFHQSRSAVRFNHTERHFQTLLQFITNTTGLEANSSVELSAEDYEGPLASMPTQETDYLLWFAWFFIIVCSGHICISSQAGQRAIERINVLWQEHQHQHLE